MTKILVPTDFSANSKAGIRFAMQCSAQQKSELIFIYILHAIRLPQWPEEAFKKYADSEKIIYEDKLKKFIAGMYKSMHVKPGKYSCIVEQGISPDISIMDYCRSRKDIEFICIATHGAGKLKKLFGTNTGNLITKSEVPVIAVPKDYRRKPLTQLLYATDFYNYKEELKKVEAFALPLKAKIKMLHLTWPYEVLPDAKTIEKDIKKGYRFGISLQIHKINLIDSLYVDLQKQIAKLKPSLIIMFTDQQRSLFQKLFFPSKSEQLSFSTTIPLLAFHKK
ncbi:MAG TPA: universal stress protein [Puia sp.]|nr:universal stress protein [Puia sp.]